jgi:hypothetical protein
MNESLHRSPDVCSGTQRRESQSPEAQQRLWDSRSLRFRESRLCRVVGKAKG